MWAIPLKGSHVVTYKQSQPGTPVDLTKPGALQQVVVWRFPPWARTLCLQFGLPFGGVLLLYILCYTLVVVGPLKGISGGLGLMDPAAHEDQFDEGEYDEF